jgi:hypothetical protein
MAKPSGDYIPLGGLVFEGQPMIAGNDNHTVTDFNPQPASAEAWHLWTVFFITGRFLYGQVWRRRDGRHWTHKKFTEFTTERDH